jgi:hypothetical protein
MSKLPKLAIERLKAKPQPPGTPGGPGNLQGARHPDANLLSAFAEKSLTDRERTEVLNHLAQCADCREMMALAVGSEPAVIESSAAVAKRRWSAWSTLRWGALAATLGAVAIVVALRPVMDRRQQPPANGPHPAVAANANKPIAPLAAEPLAPGLNPQAGLGKSEARSHNAKRLTMQAKAMPSEVSAASVGVSSAHSERAKTKQQVTMLATVRPPARLVAKKVQTEGVEEKASQSAGGLVGSATPSAPPPSSLQAMAVPAPEEETQAGLSKEAPPERVAAALKMSTADAAGKGAVTRPAGGVTVMGAAAAPPQAAQVRIQSEGAVSSRMTSRQMLMSKQGPASSQWNISPSGKVQRSDDGRKTWEDVKVADGVTFRAITAADRDVWAGGSAGALYHSSDGGLMWNRIDITASGNAVTETIVGIQSSSPLHVIVTLASGQQWVTEDGGRRWRNKP